MLFKGEQLVKVLKIKENLLQAMGDWDDVAYRVVHEIDAGQDKDANLLRAAIGLESTLYFKNNTKSKPILDEMLPRLTKFLLQALDSDDYNVVLRMLYIISAGHGDQVNMVNFFNKINMHL